MEWIALVLWSCFCFIAGAVFEQNRRIDKVEKILPKALYELKQFIKDEKSGKEENEENSKKEIAQKITKDIIKDIIKRVEAGDTKIKISEYIDINEI